MLPCPRQLLNCTPIDSQVSLDVKAEFTTTFLHCTATAQFTATNCLPTVGFGSYNERCPLRVSNDALNDHSQSPLRAESTEQGIAEGPTKTCHQAQNLQPDALAILSSY